MTRTAMFRSYLLPLGLVIALLVGWEYSKPSYPVNADVRPPQDHGPPPPRNTNEPIFQNHRRTLRQGTLRSLQQPWAEHCSEEGSKKLASSIREYFYHRGNQEQSYPERWGDTGHSYIQREWSTSDDKRIEQLIQNLYELGYFEPKALDPLTRTRITGVLKGLSVTQHPCKI